MTVPISTQAMKKSIQEYQKMFLFFGALNLPFVQSGNIFSGNVNDLPWVDSLEFAMVHKDVVTSQFLKKDLWNPWLWIHNQYETNEFIHFGCIIFSLDSSSNVVLSL